MMAGINGCLVCLGRGWVHNRVRFLRGRHAKRTRMIGLRSSAHARISRKQLVDLKYDFVRKRSTTAVALTSRSR